MLGMPNALATLSEKKTKKKFQIHDSKRLTAYDSSCAFNRKTLYGPAYFFSSFFSKQLIYFYNNCTRYVCND